ncbi:unnamed protein product [Lactuca virosa]|uniref:Peptidase C19 ubiquitin carboxyl-terminal hydrolase domain-containing protein n=1 Tax=Lactuca virosa TaxID=75947 RepID=A0AAU9M6K7_9ASTR|nr:unnamed protein product [Lactuca virosa]
MTWQTSLLLKKRKKGPPLGFKNLGNTCYLNSVLQSLTYTPPLANFCLRLQHSENWRQEDAHEFLRYVIDSCHTTCLRLKKLQQQRLKYVSNGGGDGFNGSTVVKEIFGAKSHKSLVESMSHDVTRDLLGVKLDITKYAEQEIRKLKQQINDLREERDRCISEIDRKEAVILADALAASGQTLIASSVSKGDYRSVKDIRYFVLTIGLVMGVTLGAILGVSFGSIVTLFTKDIGVLAIAITRVLPLNALAFIVDGLHYGVSDFPYAAYSMMLVGILSSAFHFYAPSGFGLHGVWSGLTLFMGLRMLAGLIR